MSMTSKSVKGIKCLEPQSVNKIQTISKSLKKFELRTDELKNLCKLKDNNKNPWQKEKCN